MSFIQRELDNIRLALSTYEMGSDKYLELYAAQQALSWAMEPTGFNSPLKTIVPNYVEPTGAAPPMGLPLEGAKIGYQQ